MLVVFVAVDVESACRKVWNCVRVSGLIRAVSSTAASDGGVEAKPSVLVSGATDWVK